MSHLTQYNFPEDLKRLSGDSLGQLCADLRAEILETVSRNGGHLASNLGVVELTVALHRVYDFPEDKLIWDVGHQAYVHKLLTGRADQFDTLRQKDGLSGFPKRKESVYDTYDSGHSSTSVSAAMGYAEGRDLKGEHHHVVAVIGDGAMTGGVAFEALNHAGSRKTSMTVILNDNNMSISPSTGGLSRHLAHLRTSKNYLQFKKSLKGTLQQNKLGTGVYKVLESTRNLLRYMLIQGTIFEEMGFKYIGPVDGHDLPALLETLERVKDLEGPVLVHVLTKKGKGYVPAENNPGMFHGVGSFDPETGQVSQSSGKTYSDVFGAYLIRLAEEDPQICAVSAAMIDGTGLTQFQKKFPDRTFDVGIAEQHAVSFAAGLALSGMKPVVAIYSTFLQRAYDEIFMEVAMQNLPVIFAVDRSGAVGADGETHHGMFDLSYLSQMPNMTVLAPASAEELEAMLAYAAALKGPCAIRYPRGAAIQGETVDFRRLQEQKAQVVVPYGNGAQRGEKVLLTAAGSMVPAAQKAAEILAARGMDPCVLNVRFVKPLDKETICTLARQASLVVTAEDNIISGGLGDSVEQALQEAHLQRPVLRLGWPDRFVPHGTQAQLFEQFELDAAGIAAQIDAYRKADPNR